MKTLLDIGRKNLSNVGIVLVFVAIFLFFGSNNSKGKKPEESVLGEIEISARCKEKHTKTPYEKYHGFLTVSRTNNGKINIYGTLDIDEEYYSDKRIEERINSPFSYTPPEMMLVDVVPTSVEQERAILRKQLSAISVRPDNKHGDMRLHFDSKCIKESDRYSLKRPTAN